MNTPLTFTSFLSIGRCIVCCFFMNSIALLADPTVKKSPITSAAKMHVAQTTLDLGQILAGALVKREIVVTNEGDADLTIFEISHTCSCTSTPEWTRVIPPKGKGRILLQFQAMAMSGKIQKTIAVRTNDPMQPVTTIALEGSVWQLIETVPTVAVMKATAAQTQSLSAVVRIIHHSDQPMELKEPISDHKQFLPRLEMITTGKEFHLTVTAHPPFPAGMLSAKITIATSSKEMPVLTIPAAVLTMPELVVHPPQVFLSTSEPAAKTPSLIHINSQSPQPLTISNASCDAPGSTVTIREITAGKEFQLSVTFPQGLAAPSGKAYTITADTSAPSQPKISIPVSFARAPAFPPLSP